MFTIFERKATKIYKDAMDSVRNDPRAVNDWLPPEDKERMRQRWDSVEYKTMAVMSVQFYIYFSPNLILLVIFYHLNELKCYLSCFVGLEVCKVRK